MMNLFKVALVKRMKAWIRAVLLITSLCALSHALAQQAPPSSLSLEQFQQWMQQQKGPVTISKPTATTTQQVVIPSERTGGGPPPPVTQTRGGLPPPGGGQQVFQTTTQQEATVVAPPATAVAVPSGARIVRPESIQFRNEDEKKMEQRLTVVRRRGVNRNRPLTYEESRRIMLRSVPPSLVPPIPDANYAFNTMLQHNTPLTPQQVVKLHQQIDISQRAAATPPLIPPKPVSTTIMINLAPGTTPPAVRLAVGYVTSLVFVDSTGAPWPIAAFDIGNPKAVNIQWDGKSNIILMQALAPYSYGDMVLRLVGLPTPVTLELVSGQRVVDYRVDIHVPGIGPNTTELPIGSNLPNPASSLLLDVLEGVSPPGSRALAVRGADCQAWLLGSRMFLRCRLTLLSPGWVGKMVSPDGMNAYELPRTASILVSRYGEPTELKIEGF
jgi:intracellular multiplication protein IcmK